MKQRFNPTLRALTLLAICSVLLGVWIAPQVLAATITPISNLDATEEPVSNTEDLPVQQEPVQATEEFTETPVEEATSVDVTETSPTDVQPTDVEATVVSETVEPTVVQPTDTVATALPTDIPATLVPTVVVPTTTTTPVLVTDQPTAVVTTEPTSVPPTETPISRGGRVKETFCQMNIDDAGDKNPFTFTFSAVNAANIQSFAWNFGDTTIAATQTASHTYTTTGTFNVTLTCTPQPGFGTTPLVLTGSITIASSPVADFEITPSDIIVGLPPMTVSTVNYSEGGGLSFVWKISTSDDPLDTAAVFYTATTENITYTFDETDITSYPMSFYFYLTVTDGAGLSTGMMRELVFNAPPPKATFNMTPNTGAAPLSVTFQGEDLEQGPITTWEWDFNNDSVIDATGIGPHNYVFPTAGVHPVRLNYAGPGGSGYVSKSVGVFADATPVQALFTYQNNGTVAGGVEVCFTNNSTGPIAVNRWDFNGDNVFDLIDNNKVVCHVYAAEGPVTVRLRVENATATSTSTASNGVNVVGSPVASFNVTPGTNITWGTNVSFTDTSTGIVTAWAWDFNGDGTTDSTTQNPTNIALTSLGANPVRLTVTGPGGSAFTEVIINVARLEITCAFSGTTDVLPGAAAQPYNSTIGNQGGRPITYTWTITGTGAGLPATYNTQNISVDWAAIGYGTFQVTLEASTADGSSCSESKTVTRSWRGLDCQMSNNLPGTLYADGQTYTFTANVQNLDGRTVTGYQWFVDGVLQPSATGASFSYANPTSTAGLPRTTTVRYEVVVSNGATYTPTTTGCFDEKAFTVQAWPTLTCTNITGSSGYATPVPTTPDNPTRSYNYTANITGAAGRTVSYLWTVSDGTITTANPRVNNNQATVRWNATAGGLAPATANDNISVAVTVTNPDGTSESCNMNRAIAVTVNRLVCNLPSGDTTPVVGETVNYSPNVSNVYGRPEATFGWEIEQLTPVFNAWTSTTKPLSLAFPDADATYRIRYSTSVSAFSNLPGDSCQSAWQPITVYGSGYNFECESNLAGNATPTNPATPYTYSIDMDNGNGINLQYRWVLRDYTGTDHVLATTTATTDGIVSSPGFTLAQLTPLFADNYTLRVEVSAVDTGLSTHTCSKSLALTAGTITVDYTYNAGSWTNTAVPVNQAICLTNTSTMVPGSISDLNYTWTVSGSPTANSWGASTSTQQQPSSCISFNTPGTYTINLTGVTDSGLRNGTKMVTFNVYGLQSIVIDRTGSSFAPSNQSFKATGTNITGSYNWTFYRIGNATPLGTRTGGTVNFNYATAGQYRAVVTGTGPLGTTTASLEFELLDANGLTAGFTASQYGGVAPMNVCFTDTSISGTPILQWEWDLDANGTFELVYTSSNIPASICHTYTQGSQVYPVSLRVTNANFVDTATNTLRTYNELESSATFSVIPQGGGYFCFDAIVSAGVTVTGWNFGDGTTGPGNDPICHTYGASGSFIVRMFITDGTTTGEVIREVNVSLTGGTPPNLNVNGACSADVRATFTINNTGGAMTTPDQVTIRDNDGNVLLIAPLQLAANASTTYTVEGYVGNITLTTVDTSLTFTTDCIQPPILSGSSVCQIDGSAVFTINNASTETAANQPYEVRDASNNVVASGTLSIPTGGSQTVTVSGVWGTLTLTSSGPQGPTTVLNITSNCDEPPLLSISHICQLDGSAVFTISNASDDTAASQPYEVRDSANVLVDSGILNIAVNGSTTVTISGNWDALTLTSTGTQGVTTQISDTSDCDEPPLLSASATCALNGTATFTVSNTSANTAASQPYEVRDASNNVVDSGTLDVPIGGSTDIVITGVYTQLTLTSTGTQGTTTSITRSIDCDQPPTLSISHVCQIDGAAVFTITNSSTETAASQPYEIRDGSSALIDSGILNVAISGSTNITVTGVWGPLTFTSTGTQGVTTQITHSSDCDEPPLLVGYADCALDGMATFSIRNDSADTAASQPYEIRDDANNLIGSGTLDVAVGATTQITINGVYTQLVMTTVGAQGVTTDLTITTDCNEPPILAISHVCQIDGSAVFTITNSSTESAADQPYEIRDASNALIDYGKLSVAIGGSTDVTLSGVWGPLTFTSTGLQGVTTQISDTSDCDEPPLLSISHVCQIDGAAVFTITNTSADTPASQPYEIRDAANNIVDSGTLDVAVGSSTDVTVSGVWGPLTFSSTGPQGVTTQVSDTSNCDEPPLLIASAVCALDGTATFTVVNDSEDTAASQPYEVRDGQNTLIDSGTLNIAVGSSVDVIISGVYAQLTLTSIGVQGVTTDVNVSTDCNEPPILTSSTSCQIDGAAVFTITNTSTETPASQPYQVRDMSGVVDSGTLEVPVGGSTDITVSGVYTTLMLMSSGTQGATTIVNAVNDCTQPPTLTGTAVCVADGIATFTIENTSSESAADQPYTVTKANGNVVDSGTLSIPANSQQVISIPDMYSQTLSFSTTGAEGVSTVLELATTCENKPTDTGDNGGETGEDPTDDTPSTPGNTTDTDNTDTGDNGDEDGIDDGFTKRLPTLDLTPQAPDTTIVERPAWEGITIGGDVCPVWLLYHTNMTGDWEVFRLGDGNDPRIASFDPNISQGVGEDVVDMSPSRSPDAEWVVFTTNRDSTEQENWELYIASIDNTVMRRVTYNTFAKDIDPAWSPDGNTIVFETDRDGNWELYLFNLSTGVETRLTDDASSDINAFWTPDSQHIVFQSDRTGVWQLYNLTVATGEVTLLSSGLTEDHDAHVSFDGEQIAFRAYETDASGHRTSRSAIYVMNIDGSGKQRISDHAGSASNHTWSPDDALIAYQSNLDGDLDIYAYEVKTEKTRLITDNQIPDYAPTWLCSAHTVVFTSDVLVDANIFNTPADPIEADPILVDKEANQMTFDPRQDIYPENRPSEEDASREGNVPPMIGGQTDE
jgi:Tol biopolymer transport system component/PKD repeat protein